MPFERLAQSVMARPWATYLVGSWAFIVVTVAFSDFRWGPMVALVFLVLLSGLVFFGTFPNAPPVNAIIPIPAIVLATALALSDVFSTRTSSLLMIGIWAALFLVYVRYRKSTEACGKAE